CLNSHNIDPNDLKLFVNGLFHILQEDINSIIFPNILEFDNFILKIHIEKLNPQCNRRTNDNLQLFKKECKKNKFNCLLVLMDGDDEALNYLQMLVQNINRNHKLKLTYPISHTHSNRIIHQNLISLSKQLEHITKTKGFHSLISNAIKELSNESSVFRLDKRLKKTDVVLNFLYSVIGKNHEEVFFKAMKSEFKNRPNDNNDNPFMPLKFSAFYYNWVLNKFGTDAEITNWCFNDILEKKVKADNYIKQNQHQNFILSEQLESISKEIYDAFKNYSNTKDFFKPSHLKIIKQATHVDIIDGLKQYLTKLFMPQDSVEYLNKMDIDNLLAPTYKRKRDDQELNNWYNELRNLRNDLDISDEFAEFLENIWEIIDDSDFDLNLDVDEIYFQRESKRQKKNERKNI
ncbi:14740_t:CDS:2, partial [Gigaspora margarita]